MQCLLLFRKSPVENQNQSPAEMQAAWGQWQSWLGNYATEILEQAPARSGPKPGGAAAVCRGGVVTDGPYVEGKEIVGGWAFVQADSFEKVLEIAREVPSFPSVEVIELATF
jgi:hypothetical protein